MNGRLKKTSRERCPECEEGFLQIRVVPEATMIRGEAIQIEREIKFCPECEYEEKPKERKHIFNDGSDKY